MLIRVSLCAVLLVGCSVNGEVGGNITPAVDAGQGVDASGIPPNTEQVPLDPNDDNSSGVQTDADGNLIIDPDVPSVLHSHIWVANSPDGTVSKINTETGVEVARYRTGPGAPDPSRTTVGLDGDVVVANRGGASAIRIHADVATCPDKNGDGVINTSTGPNDVLAWDQDECVLWYHAFPAGSLARAAAYDFVLDPDGIPRATVWVGLYQTSKLVRLDIDTGAVLSEVDIPGHCPYGLAFDGTGGTLWAFSACSQQLIRLNTDTLAWDTIPLAPSCAYGITVDPVGRVWTAGSNCVGRYDVNVGAWETVTVGSSNRGIAHDGNGSVWVADTNYGVHKLNADTMAVQDNLALSGGGFVGMAVDFHGKVWAVSRASSLAFRIDPNTLATEPFATGSSPYTYSDMTGFQLQNAAPPLGTYRAVLEGCGPDAQWLELRWSADTPVGTYVRFSARIANDRGVLATKAFVPVAKQPDDSSPADLKAALELDTLGGSYGAFLEIEIVLSSASADVTPSISDVQVSADCPPVVL